jgi:hypothetical protein
MFDGSHSQPKSPAVHLEPIGQHFNVVVSRQEGACEYNDMLSQETARADGMTA